MRRSCREDGNAEDDSAANGVSRKIAAMRAELDALAREVEQQEKEKVRKKETSGASKAPVGGGAKQQSGKPEGKPTKPEGKTTEKEPAKKNEAHRSSSPDGKPAGMCTRGDGSPCSLSNRLAPCVAVRCPREEAREGATL